MAQKPLGSSTGGSSVAPIPAASPRAFSGRIAARATPPSPSKRKLAGAEVLESSEKRPKLANKPETLPILEFPSAILERVFWFLSPESLASCLRVNKKFNAILSSEKPIPDHDDEFPVPSERIWAQARVSFYPGLPAPLSGCSELGMWKLLKGDGCSSCDTVSSLENHTAGRGVRVIWPFAKRYCRNCFQELVEKETSLLFSDSSAILPALPFAFIDKKGDFVSSRRIKQAASSAALHEPTKVFLMANVEAGLRELEEARLVSGKYAGELFLKMKERKMARLKDAEEWEAWEQDNGFRHLQVRTPASVNSAWSLSRPVSSVTSGDRRPVSATSHHRPKSDGEIKIARRREIERRCHELDPPLSPSLLQHMYPFQIAVQRVHPFTEDEWEILKPLFLAERTSAERQEQDRNSSERASHEPHMQDANPREIKEEVNRLWDASQQAVRDLLGSYADEAIRNHWSDAKNINPENAPQFAAEVLMHARKRYLSDRGREPRDIEDSSLPKNLLLDHMKWIYDTKIKPVTEKHRKDLFICNGDRCPNPAKFYEFDGVILHYAARHTDKFSVGRSGVKWREAIWPDEPPFAPDPTKRKSHHPSMRNFPHHSDPNSMPWQAWPGHMRVPTPHRPAGFTGTYDVHDHVPMISGLGPPRSPAIFGNVFQPPASPFEGSSQWVPPHGPTPAQPHDMWPVPYPVYPQQIPAFPGGFPNYPGVPMQPPYSSLPSMGVPNLYQSQMERVAEIALSVWSSIGNFKLMDPSVKMYVMIHHVVTSFQDRFRNEPSLDLFTNCLINNASMRQIKSANGLACKTCASDYESSAEHHSSSLHFVSGMRQLYSFDSLLFHFKQVHLDSFNSRGNLQDVTSSRPDWKEDMMELPADRIIENLRQLPGMDDTKFRLIAEAFPGIFQLEITTMSDTRGRTQASSDRSSPTSSRKKPRLDTADWRTADEVRIKRSSSRSLSPVAGVDEYDGRKANFAGSKRSHTGSTTRRRTELDSDNKLSNTDPDEPARQNSRASHHTSHTSAIPSPANAAERGMLPPGGISTGPLPDRRLGADSAGGDGEGRQSRQSLGRNFETPADHLIAEVQQADNRRDRQPSRSEVYVRPGAGRANGNRRFVPRPRGYNQHLPRRETPATNFDNIIVVEAPPKREPWTVVRREYVNEEPGRQMIMQNYDNRDSRAQAPRASDRNERYHAAEYDNRPIRGYGYDEPVEYIYVKRNEASRQDYQEDHEMGYDERYATHEPEDDQPYRVDREVSQQATHRPRHQD